MIVCCGLLLSDSLTVCSPESVVCWCVKLKPIHSYIYVRAPSQPRMKGRMAEKVLDAGSHATQAAKVHQSSPRQARKRVGKN